ncbi:transposase, MuDR [Tanacetum coccineum]
MECKIRHDNANYKMPIEYEKDPGLFSLKIYHAGKFKYVDDKRKYVNGLVAYVDWCDIDKFSVHEIHGVMEKLGYVNDDPIYYHYLIPATVVIEEMPSSTPVAKPTKTKRLLLEYTPTVNVEDQVVANENANETVDDVEWIRHSESVQEPEYEVNPDDLDVIDNDNFESGTDSDDDGIEKVRRKKLKQIKKAKESEDNIVHKHFFFVGQTFASADDVKERVRLHSIETRRQLYLAKNDKVRIRAKCFGRNPVFILDGEGPSTTDVGPKKKTIKGKGKQDDTPLEPNKKGISSGCLNGRVMWKKSQIPTTLTPPKHNTPVGRPRKNRRKSKEEKAEMVKDGKLSRAYKTVTCMKCGNLGHNSRSCKGQKDPYTGTSQTTPSTAPTKKPSDAGTRKRPSDAPAPSTAPAKMNQATKKQCAMSN